MSAPYSTSIVSRAASLRRFVAGLFRPVMMEQEGEPATYFLAGDESYSACINPNTGKLFATIWHDGYGKFDPTHYVSILDALRILRHDRPVSIRLRSFPRLTFEFFRLKCRSMAEAQDQVETLLICWRIT